MPEIPDPFAVPDEPRRWSGFGRWRGSGWSGPGAQLSELTDRYEDLLRSAEEMREIGNTRMAEDFQRMAEQVKNQVKQEQVAALENRSRGLPGGPALEADRRGRPRPAPSRTASRLARKPDGSWVDMPEPRVPDRQPKIAGGVGELPLKSHKTPDFIRSLKGDSDLVKWLQRVAGAGEASAVGFPTEELVETAYQEAFHIQGNPVENALYTLNRKFSNKYQRIGRTDLDMLEHLREAVKLGGPRLLTDPDMIAKYGPIDPVLRHLTTGRQYLNTTYPGLLEEKALPFPRTGGRPGRGGTPTGRRHRAPGRWDFTVGDLLDDIFKHGKDSKKAIAFASMDTFGHPEYAEQIVKVIEYLDPEELYAFEEAGQSVQLQEGLANQLGRPDLHDKVAAASPARGGTAAGWMTEAEDSAYQLRQQLGGLNPEYVSPTGPTGRRLSPPMPPTERWWGGGGARVGTDPLRPMPAMNYNLETNPEFFNPQRQLPRAALTPDDVFGLAEKNVVGGMDLDMAATREFWGDVKHYDTPTTWAPGDYWDDPRQPQPRSPAIGELMPGPKGGYPGGGGPPVGRGLSESPFPHAAGLGGRPARMPDRDAFRHLAPSPKALPFGQRVPGGVQLQMQFASGGKSIAMHGPILSAFYKMFPGQSVKDAANLLSRTPSALGHLLGNFGDDAVRLALKLPK